MFATGKFVLCSIINLIQAFSAVVVVHFYLAITITQSKNKKLKQWLKMLPKLKLHPQWPERLEN